MSKIKVIIDTDPGNDDLLAIVMALNSSKLDLLGLTVVGGNATIEDTTNNALSILTYMKRTDIPVYIGDPSALNEKFTTQKEVDEFNSHRSRIHGVRGLHVDLPKPSISAEKDHAVDFIIQQAQANKNELILVPIGPLTNIALAIKKEPNLKNWIKSIHVMGGAVTVPGNVTPHAEFNIYCDPVAANEVFSSGIDIKLCGLDITQQTSIGKQETNWLKGNSIGEILIKDLMKNLYINDPSRNSFSLHDPITVLSLIHPEIIDWKKSAIEVIADQFEFGRTIDTDDPDGSVSIAINIQQEVAKDKIAQMIGAI